jgi:epsin
MNMICTGGTISPDLFDLSQLGDALENKQQKKTPHSFLGENSSLVNLDNLVTVSKPPSMAPSPGKNSRRLFYIPSPTYSEWPFSK